MATKSLTSDEGVHIASGFLWWKEKGIVFNPEHPPLVKLLAALPFVRAIDFDYTQLPGWQEKNQWRFSDAFIFHPEVDADRLLFRARLVCLTFAVILLLVIFLFSQRLWGTGGAFLSLTLSVLCPNLLAHGGLVHTDIAASLAVILTAFLALRYFEMPSLFRLLSFALALGTALVIKFSCLLLCPLALAVFAVTKRKAFLHAMFLLVIPFCILTWTYKEWWNLEPFLTGITSVYRNHDPQYAYYLNGQFRRQGFLHYYLVALAVKTPIPTLLLWLGGMFCWWRVPRHTLWFLILPIFIFLGAPSFTRHNIGLRHVLPIVPFLMVMAGGVIKARPSPLRKTLIALCVVWLAVENLRIYPHYLAYFNSFVGGPKGGIRVLDDSNLDWGQDLKGLAAYCRQAGIKDLSLEYFGRDVPEYRGLAYKPMTVFEMYFPSGDAAVSIHYLNRHTLRSELQDYRYDWLERYKPAARIGYSIYLYRFRVGERSEFREGFNIIERSHWLQNGFTRLTALVEKNPTFTPGILALAKAHFQYGDKERARLLLEEALRLEPKNQEIRRLLGFIRKKS